MVTKESVTEESESGENAMEKYFAAITVAVMGFIFFTSTATAQTKKKHISAAFSKAAIRALVAAGTAGSDSKVVDDKMVEAEAEAATEAEEEVISELKSFAILHQAVLAQYAELAQAETEAACSLPTPSSPCKATSASADAILGPILKKDSECFTAWKASLRRLEAAQPEACQQRAKTDGQQ